MFVSISCSAAVVSHDDLKPPHEAVSPPDEPPQNGEDQYGNDARKMYW